MTKLTSLLKSDTKKLSKIGDMTGISLARLEALIGGEEPTVGELARIAGAYHLQVEDLLPALGDQNPVEVLFRATGTTDDISISTLSRRMEFAFELLGRHDTIPKWLDEFDPADCSFAAAERNANRFRDLFYGEDQVSPLMSLPTIVVERLGVLLFIVASSRFDGASAIFDGLPFAFVAERFAPRMLFTLAHELGHLLTHHQTETFAVIDVESERTKRKGKDYNKEFYAHAFASCLLMPAQGVGLTLRKIRDIQPNSEPELGDLEILLLSRIYGVSFYAAARRCEDLRLLPRGGAASLEEKLSHEFGSPEQRAKAVNLPERPSIEFPRIPEQLLNAGLQKIKSGDISVGRLSSILGVSIADLIASNSPTVH